MTYTEKELDQFLHGISLSLLSKKSAQHWRYDEETAKEIEWLEVLERKVRADKADRKTENSSEIPNNCKDAENPSGEVWECGCFLDTYCEHQIYDRNPDGTINIVECGYKPKTEPTSSKMEQVDKDINVRSKEPQIFICPIQDDYEALIEDEPRTEKPKIRKRTDKPFRAVWLDDDHNEIGTTQTERAETMSCQECKWWFTDSLKHGGYCQSLLYNHECHYEPEVDCSWK